MDLIFAMITVMIWATSAATAKLMMFSIPNLETLGVSSIFSFLFLLLLNGAAGRLKRFRTMPFRSVLRMAGLGFLGLFLYTALYYYGISQMSSQEACIVNYLWPLMVLVFSCLILRESITVRKVIAMVCSFAGIVILALGGDMEATGNRPLGILSCIAAAVCYGLFCVLNKKADMDQDLTMMIAWLTVAVCSFLTGPLLETWVPITGVQWPGLIWLGVVIDGAAYLLWAKALNRAENTARIANLAYLTPFLSLVVSAVVLKEQITGQALLALVFIIGGILIQSLQRKPTGIKANAIR